jgi:predicted oxidoreductase
MQMAVLTSTSTQTASIDRLEVSAYTIPTETPESDGTLEWHSTTMVVVHAWSGEPWGMGYTYADSATAELIRQKLAGSVIGQKAMAVPGAWIPEQ